MRWSVFSAIVMLMIASACEKPEDVLPVPPSSGESSPPASTPDELTNNENPPVDVSSELFQYGRLKNIKYRFLIPRDYDSATRYPLHIFLHGIGERGDDNEKQLQGIAPYFQSDSVREKYPAFVVIPQCPTSSYWFSGSIMDNLHDLVTDLTGRYLIDGERISIGGFSMGAYGTFAMVARYPELFEAALAIAGDGDEKAASKMKSSRWQLFAGGKDDVVPSFKTEKMARALEKAGASVLFRFYPSADHGGTMQSALSEPGLFAWLFGGTTEKIETKKKQQGLAG